MAKLVMGTRRWRNFKKSSLATIKTLYRFHPLWKLWYVTSTSIFALVTGASEEEHVIIECQILAPVCQSSKIAQEALLTLWIDLSFLSRNLQRYYAAVVTPLDVLTHGPNINKMTEENSCREWLKSIVLVFKTNLHRCHWWRLWHCHASSCHSAATPCNGVHSKYFRHQSFACSSTAFFRGRDGTLPLGRTWVGSKVIAWRRRLSTDVLRERYVQMSSTRAKQAVGQLIRRLFRVCWIARNSSVPLENYRLSGLSLSQLQAAVSDVEKKLHGITASVWKPLIRCSSQRTRFSSKKLLQELCSRKSNVNRNTWILNSCCVFKLINMNETSRAVNLASNFQVLRPLA